MADTKSFYGLARVQVLSHRDYIEKEILKGSPYKHIYNALNTDKQRIACQYKGFLYLVNKYVLPEINPDHAPYKIAEKIRQSISKYGKNDGGIIQRSRFEQPQKPQAVSVEKSGSVIEQARKRVAERENDNDGNYF